MAKEDRNLSFSTDGKIDYETGSWASSAGGRILLVLIALWVGLKKIFVKKPKVNFRYFDGISDECNRIKQGAMSWRALDIIYNYRFGSGNKWTDRWLKIRNACAVRNRLKLTKYLIKENIACLAAAGKTPKIISIASGSAQGIIELMAEAKRSGIAVQSLLIDKDAAAHEYAKKLAVGGGVAGQIQYYGQKASFITKAAEFFLPNIVEMVGFLEYRNDEQTVKLINDIHGALEPGGLFVTSQIIPNSEKIFMEKAIDWPMIYRTEKKFKKIMERTGFKNNYAFHREPLGLHFIIECKKI